VPEILCLNLARSCPVNLSLGDYTSQRMAVTPFL
jgi:hypothetical protein